MRIICDIETERLVDPEKIHCIVCLDIDTGEEYVFENVHENPLEFRRFSNAVIYWVGHNFVSFDRRVIYEVCDISSRLDSVLDTFITSKLLNYRIEGGHSLEAWGKRLGEKKLHAKLTDFSVYTPEILERCKQDVKINLKLFRYFEKYITNPRFTEAIRLEHDLQELCQALHHNGFPFDNIRATDLLRNLQSRLALLDTTLATAFPPKKVLVKTFLPRWNQNGKMNAVDQKTLEKYGYSVADYKAGPVELYEDQEFNPGSVKQIVERLNETGWKPTDKTKGHIEAEKDKTPDGRRRLQEFRRVGWRITEENLRTLPENAPEASQSLVQRLLIASRVSDLEEWLNLYNATTGAIHGNFQGIGSWTHRASHQKPNMANIPVAKRTEKDTELQKISNDINDEMRKLWVCKPGNRLVGVDADGIQMRIFAHYVNDPKLTTSLIEGSKELGTDIHTLHWNALKPYCKGRDPAKTFIYAWLLGAGVGKVSEILECSPAGARECIQNFIRFYPGLEELKQTRLPANAKRGYFEALDGRFVISPGEHWMLAGYLQSGEKIVMARAAREWNRILKEKNLPYVFRNFVHDEFVIEIPDDDELDKIVSSIVKQSIVNQGTELRLNCPLAATSHSGKTWQEIH